MIKNSRVFPPHTNISHTELTGEKVVHTCTIQAAPLSPSFFSSFFSLKKLVRLWVRDPPKKNKKKKKSFFHRPSTKPWNFLFLFFLVVVVGNVILTKQVFVRKSHIVISTPHGRTGREPDGLVVEWPKKTKKKSLSLSESELMLHAKKLLACQK